MSLSKPIIELVLSPEQAADNTAIYQAIAQQWKVKTSDIAHIRLLRRSIDARNRNIKILLKFEAYLHGETIPTPPLYLPQYPKVNDQNRTIIIGAGPAGLFAALRLIELGIKPIILERGKTVRDRRRDLALLNRTQTLNPESNYCFGEGGAGTYSDGKLYTRSDKRGNINNVLQTFVKHGASPDILIDVHPHIGTNKLPQIITAIRESILNAGGEYHFNTKVCNFDIQNQQIKGVFDQHNNHYQANNIILATGHSARDIFELLYRKNILIEAKPFALGIRIEHQQSLIDAMQYKCDPKKGRGDYLPPAAYSFVQQVNKQGVYSFCMCPGGIIAPCATDTMQVVTNGWSPSRRNNPYSNSGIVTTIEPHNWTNHAKGNTNIPIDPQKATFYQSPLSAMQFQADIERQTWLMGGCQQTAPAQRLIDFINNKISTDLPTCSYQPGIVSAQLSDTLPTFVTQRLRQGLYNFGKIAPSYYTNDAVLVAVESRTSSPIRIPRQSDTLQHPQINNLYPCGEGAGYAGGIVSAAIDGIRCAEAIAQNKTLMPH